MKSVYKLDFGNYDDTQNYDWKAIRKIMTGDEHNNINLEEMIFAKEKAEELKDVLNNSDYTGYSVEMIMEGVLFDDIFYYVKDAEVSNYEWGAVHYGNKDLPAIIQIDISEDPDLHIDTSRIIEYEGKDYIYINWGESENSYIHENLYSCNWGEFWTAGYYNHESKSLYSFGNIYQSEEEAKQELLNDGEDKKEILTIFKD